MPVMTKGPKGDDIVILSRKEYAALVAAREDRDDAMTLRRVRARREAADEELLSSDDAIALLQAPTPLAFWRKKRGLTQASLAASAGIAQGFLSEIERGDKIGDVRILASLARSLSLTLDDLVTGEPRQKRKAIRVRGVPHAKAGHRKAAVRRAKTA
jgi:DNA-binding XRE family transcriptional regulator